jgi:hypothetical protein
VERFGAIATPQLRLHEGVVVATRNASIRERPPVDYGCARRIVVAAPFVSGPAKEALQMEKAIVVVVDLAQPVKKRDAAITESLVELNQHLADGWRVKNSSGMSGTAHLLAANLVILERDA